MSTWDFRSRVLGNGLSVVLHKDNSMPIVCINIAYNVGSRDEQPGLTGFAHLFEHLMFAGSRNVPHGMFDAFCEQAGGYNNAYTNEDKTNYYIVLPSNALELGLWLESDRLLALDLSAENLEIQRSVVLEEKRQREDNQPYGSFEKNLARLLYPAHPYGHPVIGSTEDIENAQMAAVEHFHNTFYVPENAVLSISGDIDCSATFSLVEKYFDSIPAGRGIPKVQDLFLPPDGERREIIPDDVPLPAVFVGYRVMPEGARDFIAMDVLAEILGSGESSRLHRGLVYEQQIASEAFAFIETRQFQSCLVVAAFANDGISAEELERAIDVQIQKIIDTGVTATEMERNLNRIETTQVQSMQMLSSRAERFAHFQLFYREPGLTNSLLERYRKTTSSEVHAAADYLGKNNRVVLHYIPRT